MESTNIWLKKLTNLLWIWNLGLQIAQLMRYQLLLICCKQMVGDCQLQPQLNFLFFNLSTIVCINLLESCINYVSGFVSTSRDMYQGVSRVQHIFIRKNISTLNFLKCICVIPRYNIQGLSLIQTISWQLTMIQRLIQPDTAWYKPIKWQLIPIHQHFHHQLFFYGNISSLKLFPFHFIWIR